MIIFALNMNNGRNVEPNRQILEKSSNIWECGGKYFEKIVQCLTTIIQCQISLSQPIKTNALSHKYFYFENFENFT